MTVVFTEDNKVIITAAEAAMLLRSDKDDVHNFANPHGGLFIGCDYERSAALAAFRDAQTIEIGGPGCKASKHPLAVTDTAGRVTFFEADMEKVAAFELARAAGTQP